MPDPELTSTAFADGAPIPAKYTGDGADISPPLAWSFLPEGTRSVALIVHDPDAPSGDFTHWVAWNLDPEQGSMDGVHRYFHEISAVDTVLNLPAGASRDELEAALDGHVLGTARLVGLYGRPA